MGTEAKLRKHVAFPSGPVVKKLPSEAGHSVPSLAGELRCHVMGPRSPSPKKKNTAPPPQTGEVRPTDCINVNSLTAMLIKG